MNIVGFAHRVDDTLIDKVFQPLLDLCWSGKSVWQLGLNFQLGSFVLSSFSIFLPVFLSGNFSTLNVQNILALILGFVLFLGFSRMHVVERAGMGNPLRPAFFSFRLLVLVFSLFSLFSYNIFSVQLYSPSTISHTLSVLSDIVFLIGLYCMACRTSPPKQRKRKLAASYIWRGNA